MTIVFNYPATSQIESVNEPSVIQLAYLLYDCEYEIVINDVRTILYNYKSYHSFSINDLHCIDYNINGSRGNSIPIDIYNEYLNINAINYFYKKAPLVG